MTCSDFYLLINFVILPLVTHKPYKQTASLCLFSSHRKNLNLIKNLIKKNSQQANEHCEFFLIRWKALGYAHAIPGRFCAGTIQTSCSQWNCSISVVKKNCSISVVYLLPKLSRFCSHYRTIVGFPLSKVSTQRRSR